jgi:hypothetical protein
MIYLLHTKWKENIEGSFKKIPIQIWEFGKKLLHVEYSKYYPVCLVDLQTNKRKNKYESVEL